MTEFQFRGGNLPQRDVDMGGFDVEDAQAGGGQPGQGCSRNRLHPVSSPLTYDS